MRISVNGEDLTLGPACTVSELLERLDLVGRACAVEVNQRIVPRAEHEERSLAEGDAVEIVTIVGGG